MLTESKRTAGCAGPAPRAAMIALAALAATLPACAHRSWQHRSAAASVQAVNVLAVTAAGKVPIAQYWDRNTLLLDLTHLSPAGSATLTPVPANGGWPVRLEFRVQPGAIGRLEVLGAQRVTFVVPASGAVEVLKLDPGVYLADTGQISLRWSAAGDLPR